MLCLPPVALPPGWRINLLMRVLVNSIQDIFGINGKFSASGFYCCCFYISTYRQFLSSFILAGAYFIKLWLSDGSLNMKPFFFLSFLFPDRWTSVTRSLQSWHLLSDNRCPLLLWGAKNTIFTSLIFRKQPPAPHSDEATSPAAAR